MESSDKQFKLFPKYRVVTFVPPENLAGLIQKVIETEGSAKLMYGNYDSVAWWSSPGTEQFRPLEGSSAAIGEIDALLQVPSIRLEFSVPRDHLLLEMVLGVIRRPWHRWEEPVVQVYEVIEMRREIL